MSEMRGGALSPTGPTRTPNVLGSSPYASDGGRFFDHALSGASSGGYGRYDYVDASQARRGTPPSEPAPAGACVSTAADRGSDETLNPAEPSGGQGQVPGSGVTADPSKIG